MMRNRAQQEMVGFVLIVVIVLVGIVVFMVFTARQNSVTESDIANNILSSIMKTSSSCALVYEPNYDDMRDLFRSCYDNRRCSTTNELACDVLESSLRDILEEVLVLEPVIMAYQLDFSHGTDEGSLSLLHLVSEDLVCPGTLYRSEPHSIRISSEEHLVVILKLCIASDA